MIGGFDWTELFFSSSGRAARGPSIAAAGLLVVILALYESVIDGPLRWLTGWVVYPALVFSACCVLSKRLHDRGRSGWLAALVLVAIFMVWPHPQGFLDFLGVVVLGWAAVDLGLIPGEQGANRFGPNPQRSDPAGAGGPGTGSPGTGAEGSGAPV